MQSIHTSLLLPSLLLLAAHQAGAAESVLARSVRVVDGKSFTLTKYVDENGAVRGEITDASGRVIPEAALPHAKRSRVAAEVLNALKGLRAGQRLTVAVALNLPSRSASSAQSAGAEVVGGREQRAEVNGLVAATTDLAAHEERLQAAERSERRALAGARAQAIRAWAQSQGLQGHTGIARALTEGGDSVVLDLDAAQLKRLVASQDRLIAGIELHEEPKDDIVQAMADTSISSSALPNSTTRGAGIGIYMTESGCADPSRITNYTRLAGSETDHSRNVGAIVRAVSPESWLYCRGGAVLPVSTDLDGVGGNPAIFIMTRSNSSNDTTNYNTVDRDWDNYVYNNNVAHFNSAGNEGNGTGNVTSPGKAFNTTTVGNYNDADNTISSSSSFVNPQTGAQKPETVGPGVNITAGGFTMSGTSQSTPHAAGFAADMMSGQSVLRNRPYLLKAKMLAGSTDVITGGTDKVGLGGFDFASAYWNGHWQYYSGSNGSFSTFDSGDGASDGYISKVVNISSSWSKVRAVISWVNRGTWTYDHRNDAHPIGQDLDFSVYGPTGAYVGGSASFDNPYESVQFTPTVSGNYTFKIRRYANRDTASDLRIGLHVNYFN